MLNGAVCFWQFPLLISFCIFPKYVPDHNPYPSLLFLTIMKTSVCFEQSRERVCLLPSAVERLPGSNMGLLLGMGPMEAGASGALQTPPTAYTACWHPFLGQTLRTRTGNADQRAHTGTRVLQGADCWLPLCWHSDVYSACIEDSVVWSLCVCLLGWGAFHGELPLQISLYLCITWYIFSAELPLKAVP